MKKILYCGSIVVLGIMSHHNPCTAQESEMFQIVGFATVNGNTTGGAGGNEITVSNGTDLQNALKAKQKEETPLTIYVDSTINLDNSTDLSKIDVKDLKDVSIIGTGAGADFDGIGIKIWKASNIIIRNLKIHHVLSGEKDCISIEGPADHIWIDHCELFNEYQEVEKDYYDGLLDAKAEAEYLTYSWNFLHDSWKTALVGSSESDIFDRKLTMHHNYFMNCNSRLPLFRASTGHFFNNYFRDIASTAINSRINACVLIENNYFENANNPWVSAYSDVLGGGEITGNILVNSPFVYSDDTHELPSCSPSIPYEYSSVLNDASDVPALVETFAGVGKLALSMEFPAASTSFLNIHPNPVKGVASISIQTGSDPFVLWLVDMTGRKILLYEGTGSLSGIQTVEADLTAFQSGLYILLYQSGNRISGSRLIIGNR
jgi:pectate lyase